MTQVERGMFDPPPLLSDRKPLSEVVLCDELGVKSYEGACPVHGGDACLARFVPAALLEKEAGGEGDIWVVESADGLPEDAFADKKLAIGRAHTLDRDFSHNPRHTVHRYVRAPEQLAPVIDEGETHG